PHGGIGWTSSACARIVLEVLRRDMVPGPLGSRREGYPMGSWSRSWRRRFPWASVVLCTALLSVSPGSQGSAEPRPAAPGRLPALMRASLADRHPVQRLSPMGFPPCTNGHAGHYPCNNVDLESFLPLSTIGGGSGSDLWGWTDPQTGKEYALMGRSTGT